MKMNLMYNTKNIVIIMYNPETKVTIECTQSYVKRWADRGFVIKYIVEIGS